METLQCQLGGSPSSSHRPPPLHFLGYSRVPLQILGSFFLQPYHPLLFYSPGLNLSKAFLLEQVPSGKNSTWVKKKKKSRDQNAVGGRGREEKEASSGAHKRRGSLKTLLPTWGHLPPEVARLRTSSTTLRREAGSCLDTRMAWLKRRRAGIRRGYKESLGSSPGVVTPAASPSSTVGDASRVISLPWGPSFPGVLSLLGN